MGDIEKELSLFNEILEKKHEVSKRFKSQEPREIVGYFCSYFPEEIVHAAGMIPIRILGGKKKLINTEAYLPSFGCSFVRTALELGLSGELDYLSGVVFSHTCDSIQVLSDIWRDIFKDQFVANIIFPVKLNDPHAHSFLINELETFKRRLETYLGRSIEEEAIWDSIQVYEKNRNLLEQLYKWRKEHPGVLRGSDMLKIVIASMLVRKEEHNEILEHLLETLINGIFPQSNMEGKALVLLAGNICAFPDIVDVIEDSKTVIIDDDLCTGSRYFSSWQDNATPKGKEETALSFVARTYMDKSPCPAKYSSDLCKDGFLLDKVENCKADGVIFILLKLCDPYSHDSTFLKKALEKKGYPFIVIEHEQQTESYRQLQTRVEAFAETIKA